MSNYWSSGLCFTPHTACRSAAPIAEKVTHVNYTLFQTAAMIL